MPTARPSIRARTGAVALSSTKPVSVVMPAIPTPTPTNAVSSGRPAAMTEPNITTRMTAAAATPKSSPAPPDSCSVAATPENSTCSPASRPGSAASKRVSRLASSTSSGFNAYVTVDRAIRSSAETPPVVNGSVTDATSGSSATRSSTSATAAFRCAVSSRSPGGAASTTFALACSSPACGKRSASTSRASWDSVPGIENSSEYGPDRVPAATPMPIRTASHRAATTRRRRYDSRPSRYRREATAISSFGSAGCGTFSGVRQRLPSRRRRAPVRRRRRPAAG